MHFERETLIAAVIILVLLVLGFLSFQIYVARVGVTIVQDNSLIITPLSTIEPTQATGNNILIEEAEILPGVFGQGMPVVISNTGGDGLRIRDIPGLNSTPLFLGADGEAFKIVEGPSLIDSKIWWKIESISDSDRTGWAVQDYLNVQQ